MSQKRSDSLFSEEKLVTWTSCIIFSCNSSFCPWNGRQKPLERHSAFCHAKADKYGGVTRKAMSEAKLEAPSSAMGLMVPSSPCRQRFCILLDKLLRSTPGWPRQCRSAWALVKDTKYMSHTTTNSLPARTRRIVRKIDNAHEKLLGDRTSSDFHHSHRIYRDADLDRNQIRAE